MLRSTLHITLIIFAASVLSLAVILFGFFASPNAVRTSPVSVQDTLLLNQLQ